MNLGPIEFSRRTVTYNSLVELVVNMMSCMRRKKAANGDKELSALYTKSFNSFAVISLGTSASHRPSNLLYGLKCLMSLFHLQSCNDRLHWPVSLKMSFYFLF
jgi:hypothetical protein